MMFGLFPAAGEAGVADSEEPEQGGKVSWRPLV